MSEKETAQPREGAPKPQTCTVSIEGAFLRPLPCQYAPINARTHRYQELELVDARGHIPVIRDAHVLWAPADLGVLRGTMFITAQNGHLLDAPGGSNAAMVSAGACLQLADTTRWLPVMHQGSICWISRQFTMD